MAIMKTTTYQQLKADNLQPSHFHQYGHEGADFVTALIFISKQLHEVGIIPQAEATAHRLEYYQPVNVSSNSKIIHAKFNSNCAETGARITKGQRMLYDYTNKKCYCEASNAYAQFEQGETGGNDGTGGMVEANENAYFDNWSAVNL